MRFIFLLFILFLLAPSVYAKSLSSLETFEVVKVMDGDTFRLSNGQKLKLAGVNAAELHDTPKLPQEARRFNKEVWAFRNLAAEAERIAQNFVKQNKNEILIETATQTFDEQENLLGYVYISVSKPEAEMMADGGIFTEQNGRTYVLLNAYFLKLGLAELTPGSLDSKYENLFSKLEAEAKQNKKGLWS